MEIDNDKFFQQLKELGYYSEQDLVELKDCLKDYSKVKLNKKFFDEKEAESEEEINDIRYLISKMGVAEKVKLAMFGNATCRGLLIQDPLRMIQTAVLKNPRIQENELEAFAKNPNTAENILRQIADNRKWIQSYQIKTNLVFNPKTPQDIALKWISFLNKTDIRNAARSKNLPQVVVNQARRIVNR